jgi:hypothetical protein
VTFHRRYDPGHEDQREKRILHNAADETAKPKKNGTPKTEITRSARRQ